MVAKLISVKDTNTATALEVAAGGKLFQVIVDTEVTSKALIDRGQLTRRYTIIPINKVKFHHEEHFAKSWQAFLCNPTAREKQAGVPSFEIAKILVSHENSLQRIIYICQAFYPDH